STPAILSRVGGWGSARGRLGLDEDALPRTVHRRVDHAPLVALGHGGEALVASGVVEHPVTVLHVRDAVLQEDEHLRTVVDAQPVARAEVLVDPDPHGRAGRGHAPILPLDRGDHKAPRADGPVASVGRGALSYAGTLAVTMIADPDVCPDLDRLAVLLEAELRGVSSSAG